MRTQATREATLYAQRVGDVAGYAIDGLFSGESLDARAKCIEAVTRNLPSDGIRFLTGCAGAPWDVIDAVSNGVDVIHASYPFELAAHGFASHLSSADTVNLRDRVHVTDRTGLVKGCECWVCQGFTKGYVRHLLEVREMMGTSLLVAHNVWDYYVWFDRIRAAVDEGRWDSFRDDWQRAVERVRVGDVA